MKQAFFGTVMLLAVAAGQAADGVVNVASTFTVGETADRLERVLTSKGMTIFKRVKHSEGAQGVGIDIRPTQLIIFGNPKVGSPLMRCQQSIALDLPQKALIWQDQDSKVWISYNDPAYLEQRHGVTGCDKVFAKVTKALAAMTKSAASE